MRHLRWCGFLGLAVSASISADLFAQDKKPVGPTVSVTNNNGKTISGPLVRTGSSVPQGGLSEGTAVSSPVATAPFVSNNGYSSEVTPTFDTGSSWSEWDFLRSWVGEDHRLPSDIEDPMWFRVEALTGWFKGAKTPALLTTGPQESLGILGEPGVTVLYGNETVHLKQHYGARIAVGGWFNPSQKIGFEGNYFWLMNNTVQTEITSTGDPLLARPFFNTLTGLQDSAQVANLTIPGSPDILPLQGQIKITHESRFQGFEVLAVGNWARGNAGRVDWVNGFKYLRLDEGIGITENLFTPADENGVIANRFLVYDDFSTENTFWGWTFGLRSQWYWGCWTLGLSTQMALGMTRQTVEINGGTFQITPPPNLTLTSDPGGVLALSSNIGTRTKSVFAVAPKIEARLSYQLCDHVQMYGGYSFQYLSSVVRPHDQIDLRVNPNLFPPAEEGGDALPGRLFKKSSFYVNALFLGFDVSY